MEEEWRLGWTAREVSAEARRPAHESGRRAGRRREWRIRRWQRAHAGIRLAARSLLARRDGPQEGSATASLPQELVRQPNRLGGHAHERVADFASSPAA